jgi:hypothetical protein
MCGCSRPATLLSGPTAHRRDAIMLRKGLTCIAALYIAACAPSTAADLPMKSTPPECPLLFTEVMPSLHTTLAATQVTHRFRSPLRGEGAGVGVAWGLAPGAGQLGAAGLGYCGVTNCWSYQLVYDRFGNYLGEQPANICLDLPRD